MINHYILDNNTSKDDLLKLRKKDLEFDSLNNVFCTDYFFESSHYVDKYSILGFNCPSEAHAKFLSDMVYNCIDSFTLGINNDMYIFGNSRSIWGGSKNHAESCFVKSGSPSGSWVPFLELMDGNMIFVALPNNKPHLQYIICNIFRDCILLRDDFFNEFNGLIRDLGRNFNGLMNLMISYISNKYHDSDDIANELESQESCPNLKFEYEDVYSNFMGRSFTRGLLTPSTVVCSGIAPGNRGYTWSTIFTKTRTKLSDIRKAKSNAQKSRLLT